MEGKYLSQANKKLRQAIVIPSLTLMIIGAQLAPGILGNVDNATLQGLIDSIPSSVIVVQAATEENFEEMDTKYGIGKSEATPDKKYVRVAVNGQYYKTVEGYVTNTKVRKELKEYLGTDLFLPSGFREDGNHDYASTVTSALVGSNYFNLRDLLSTKSGRADLAKIGADNTTWINEKWVAAPELTLLASMGVVNDDYNLVKYNNTGKISREQFYAMLWRYNVLNCGDSNIDAIPEFNKAKAALLKANGENYKYNNSIYWALEDSNGGFYDIRTTKKSVYQSSITRAEMFSLIGNSRSIETPSYAQMKKELIKAFKDIKASNFQDFDASVSGKKLTESETSGIWLCWKLGVLKPDSKGNLNLLGKVSYSQAVRYMVNLDIKTGEEYGY